MGENMSRYSLFVSTNMLLCLAASNVAAQQGGNPDYGHHNWDGPWHGWFMGPLVMMLFLAVLVIAVVLLVRWFSSRGENHSTGGHMGAANSALDILKERFARGEIDKDEYEERRKTLQD